MKSLLLTFAVSISLIITSTATAYQDSSSNSETGLREIGTIEEGLKLAKQNDMPLVVFGLSET